MSSISDFRDEYKLITQADKDGGDTANRTGLYYAVLALGGATTDDLGRPTLDGFRADVGALTSQYGEYFRHPGNFWYSNPRCFSRDQHAPLILAAAALKDKTSLKQLISGFPKRWFFHQNNQVMGPDSASCIPDIMSPGEISCIIRGFGMWYIYPVLVVLDLFSLSDLFFRTTSPWGYDNLVAARLAFELKTLPTPITWLNALIYRTTDWTSAIQDYYSLTHNGIPPLGELYTQTCLSIFSQIL